MSFDERFRGQQFAWIWAVAMFAGIAAISLSPVGATVSFTRLAVPMIIMLGYAWIGYKRCLSVYKDPALHEARIAQLADSLYFLGFLWTLWALIDSFVLKNLTAAQGVFRIFGYALVTTAAGMFSRMLLLQFRYSGGEQLAVAQSTVEDQLRLFSAELENTIRSVRDFQLSTEKATKEWHAVFESMTAGVSSDVRVLSTQVSDIDKAITKIHAEALNRIYATLESATGKLTDELNKPVNELKKSAAGSLEVVTSMVQDELDAFRKTLRAGGETLRKELEGFARLVAEIRVPSDFQVTTTTIAEKIRAIEDALGGLVAVLKRDREFDNAFAEAEGKLKICAEKVGSEVDLLARRIHEIRVPEEVVLRTEEIRAKMQVLERALASLSGAFDATEAIAHSLDNLPVRLTSFAESLDRTARRVETVRMVPPELPPEPPPPRNSANSGFITKVKMLFRD